MTQRLTRRAALSLAGTAAAGAVLKPPAAKQLPRVGEFVRFLDEITEAPVVRLTSLGSANYLPARENRAISVKGKFLVFSSDRAGSLSPFRLDLRTGQVIQLMATTSLDPWSLSLDAAGRVLLFLDGRTLKQLNIATKRVQVLAEGISGFSMGASSQDVFSIRDGGIYGAGWGSRPLAEGAVWCQVRPGGDACLFLRGSKESGELWHLRLRDPHNPARLTPGTISEPCWSADGRSVFFLRNGFLCEVIPESVSGTPGSEVQIDGSSRFAIFSPNADSSVFVGAIRSKAQPTINLLLRNPAREFTLCEHKATHPEACAPVFSGDSRRVYFNSDFQGKPAIYSVNVETLIEETSG